MIIEQFLIFLLGKKHTNQLCGEDDGENKANGGQSRGNTYQMDGITRSAKIACGIEEQQNKYLFSFEGAVTDKSCKIRMAMQNLHASPSALKDRESLILSF